MNPITDIIFTLTWFALLVIAIRQMSRGWIAEKPVHPEMRDVEPGTELMGVNFEQKTSCDLEGYKDLQARIEVLRAELEGEDDDDDDDDDGGDVVALNR